MLKINEPLDEVRKKVVDLQQTIAGDSYFHGVPSIEKKKATCGYFLHAKDDLPEVKKMAFELIKGIDCSFEAVVGRKNQHFTKASTTVKRLNFMPIFFPIYSKINSTHTVSWF